MSENKGDIRLFSREDGPSEPEARRVIARVLSQYDQVLLAYLYGSFVRHDLYQDIDIALLLTEKMDPYDLFRLQMRIAGEIEGLLSHQVPCDVRILNGAPVEFQDDVIRTGRIVFCRNDLQRIDFETDVMRQYLDHTYLFERVDHAFLARVGR